MKRIKAPLWLMLLSVIALAAAAGKTSSIPVAALKAEQDSAGKLERVQEQELSAKASDAGEVPVAAEPPAQQANAAAPAAAAEQNVTDVAVTSVQFISAVEGWAGGPGAVLHTKDGGATWQKQFQANGLVESFSFINASTGWAFVSPPQQGSGQSAGSNPPSATLLRTNNGGADWTEVTKSAPIGPNIRFISDKEGFSGSRYTADGGATWTELPVPANMKGEPYFMTRDLGWAVTMKVPEYKIELTRDGGKTWKTAWSHNTVSTVTSAVIRSSGDKDVWALLIGETGMNQTSYTLLNSQDEGKSWKTVVANSTAGGGPAPGYKPDEQVARKGPGTKPGQLVAVNRETAFLLGECPPCGDGGAVTAGWTHDGGVTWVNGAQQLPGQNAAASFVDGKQGFIVLSSYGKPSTLYKTEDGGKKWTVVQTFGKKASSS